MSRRFAASIIIAALLGGGISHATVVHEHGHSHASEESSIWASLHSALRHEDTQSVATMFEDPLMFLLALVLMLAGLRASFGDRHERASVRDPYASRALRAGILRYRAFG